MTIDNNVSSIVRTAAVFLLAVPLTLNISESLKAGTALNREKAELTKQQLVYRDLQGKMVLPCIKYRISKNDSKLEREAKNELDEIFGGEVTHGPACNFVLNSRA